MHKAQKFNAIVLLGVLLATQPFQTIAAEFSDEAMEYLADTFSPDEPGVSVVVSKNGETLFSGAVGAANLELLVALKADMSFEIASLTKQITSASILILEEEGKLSIADPVAKYFPEHPSGSATLEQLMRNISGTFVPDHSMGSNHIRQDITATERQELIASGDPLFQPGERYSYSNAGYWLLGDIIELVSGMDYGAFLMERIFTPLGMKDSYYGDHRELIDGKVSGYDYTDEGIKNATFTSDSWAYSAGGLISSAEDIAKWSNALFSGQIIEERNLSRMLSPSVLNDGTEVPYGLGLVLSEVEGYNTAEHGGGHSGFLAHSTRLVEEDIFVVVLANYFYISNGYRPPQEKNPAEIARKLAILAATN